MKNKLTILIFVLLGICRIQAQVTAVLTPPTGCESNGMIELTDINGEGPFTIDWSVTTSEPSPSGPPKFIDTPLLEWNNQTKITGLAPGMYCVTVKDAKCCEARYCFDLEKKEGSIKVVYKKNTFYCHAIWDGFGKAKNSDCSGAIEIGGLKDPNLWAYKWTKEDEPGIVWNTQNIKDLCPGTYILTAINKETGCEETLTVTICCCTPSFILGGDDFQNPTYTVNPEPPIDAVAKSCPPASDAEQLSVTHQATPPSATGKSNGSIKLTVSGGTNSPIYYSWKEEKTGKEYATKDISGLPSGNYCYTVTNGCAVVKDCVPIYVCEENKMSITTNIEKPCLFVNKEAKIDLTNSGAVNITNIKGGVAPYKFVWSNGATTQSIAKLVTNKYCVTITDKGGCTYTECFEVKNKEYEYKRVGCTDYYYCDKSEVYKKDWGTYEAYDPIDCRFVNTYCKDDTEKKKPITKKFIGTTFQDFGQCILYEYCPNNSIYQTHYGIPFSGLNSNCQYVTGCDYPTAGQSTTYSSVSKITKTIIELELIDQFGNSVYSCTITTLCDGKKTNEIKYDGPCPSIGHKVGNDDEDFTNLLNEEAAKSIGVVNSALFEEFDYNNTKHKDNVSASVKNAYLILYPSVKKGAIAIKSIIPNPFENSFELNINSEIEQSVTLDINDLLGKNYYNRKHLVYSGSNKLELSELGEVPQGIYILNCRN